MPRAPQPAAWQHQPCSGSLPTLQDGCVSSWAGTGQRTRPPRATADPGQAGEVHGRRDPLERVRLGAGARTPGGGGQGGGRVGQVADERGERVGREREVGLDHARVSARLVVDRAGQAHHAGALAALRIGDVGAAVRVDAERVDQPVVRALDRLAGARAGSGLAHGGEWAVEPPVGVNAARAARLDEQMARPLGQQGPQRIEPLGRVDVDPQEARGGDRVLGAGAAQARATPANASSRGGRPASGRA